MISICPMCSSVVNLPDSMQGKPFFCEHCRRPVELPLIPLSASLSLSDFVIREEIRQGATGTLYRAFQTSLGREVALKILSPERGSDRSLVRQFVMRTRLLAEMRHPAYVHVYAIGEEGGLYFRSTELVVGESVAARIARKGRLAPQDVVLCGRVLAEALQSSWDQCGAVADGLSPDDVLLANRRVRLVRAGEPQAERSMDETGDELPLRSHVAPEVVLGQPTDVRASFYALGVLLFRAATGKAPFADLADDATSAEYLYRHAPSLRELVEDFPEDVARVIQRLLRRDPEERFATGGEVAVALGLPGERLEVAAANQAVDGENWRCPGCHTVNSTKGKYCRECGAYGMEPCPACGQGVHLETAFCPFCGANMKAKRDAARERGETLLLRLRDSLETAEWKSLRTILLEYGALDVSVLPDEQVRAFESERRRAFEMAVAAAVTAERALDLEMFEGSVELLNELGEDLPATAGLARRLERCQAELADGIYQANVACQTRCYDRARLILEGLPPWTGAVLGARRAQLAEDSARRIEQRRAAILRAQELMGDTGARTDALQVRAELAGFRLSRKLLVVSPSTEDLACEERMGLLMAGIERNVATTVQALLREDHWDAIVDLLERTGDADCQGGVISRRTLAECAEREVKERCKVARESESKGHFREAREAWRRVMLVPGMFLAEPIRRECLDFERRRERVMVSERRVQLGGHLSAVMIVWCLAFALTGVNAIADWYDGAFSLAGLARGFGPLLAHLAALFAVFAFLRTPRVIGGDELLPRRHASLFFIGLAALWIVSPMVWVGFEVTVLVTQRILNLGSGFLWIGPVAVGVIWLLADVLRLWRQPCLPASLALTLSWWAATATANLTPTMRNLEDAMLVLTVSGLQLAFFAGVHVAHHFLMRAWAGRGRRSGVAPVADKAGSLA